MTPLSPTDITIIEQQQKHLASKVITDNNFEQINTVAGVDVAYNETTGQVVGAISVLDATTLQVVESQTAIEAVSFPYIPGLFSFRELPPLLSAFNK
jgi:deoxyribonuclease V